MGLNSKYRIGKWKFITREQRVGGGSMDEKLLKGNIKGKGGFWLNWPNRIFAEDKPEWSDVIWGMVEDEEPDQICKVVGSW